MTDLKPFYSIRLSSGELICDEFAWMGCDGPDDWTLPDEADHWGDDVEYEIVYMVPVSVNKTTYPLSVLCPTCNGNETLMVNGTEFDCGTCDGEGSVDRKQEGHDSSRLLTNDEKLALALTGTLANLFGKIVGKSSSRDGDLNEIVGEIHNLQARLMGQAAARAYPQQFRLLGETLPDPE